MASVGVKGLTITNNLRKLSTALADARFVCDGWHSCYSLHLQLLIVRPLRTKFSNIGSALSVAQTPSNSTNSTTRPERVAPWDKLYSDGNRRSSDDVINVGALWCHRLAARSSALPYDVTTHLTMLIDGPQSQFAICHVALQSVE